MATPAPTVLNAIDALFITLYNRVADYSDYVGFSASLGYTYQQAAGTPATVAQFETLAAQMTGPSNSAAVLAYYNTNYGSLTPSAFVTALYTNLGGPTNQAGIAPGVTYWTGQILKEEAAGTPQPQAYTDILGQFVDAFLTYSGNDPAALQRQQTLNNKVAVSEFYAQASQTNAFLIPTSPSGAAFQAVQNVIANVTAAYSTVVAAEAEITAAVAQQSLTPILGTTFTLTGGIDTITTGAVGAIFNAPLVTSTLGIVNSNSLNPTDSIVDTNKDGTLNATIGLLVGSTINDAVVPNVTLSGVSTANVTVIYDGGIGGLVPPPSAVQVGGFAGTITGLTTVNDVNSSETLQLGLSNDGLGTVLQNLNVSGFTATRGSPVFGVLLQAGLGSLTNTIHVNLQDSVYGTNALYALGGPISTPGAYGHVIPPAPGTYSTGPTVVLVPVGGTGFVLADTLAIGNDGAPGTIAAPNLSYGTWALTTAKGSEFLQLTDNADIIHGALYNSNVNAATAITLAGAGNVTLGTDAMGNWANLATIDASAMSAGSVTINGAASGITSNAFGSLSLGGSAWGLLDGDSALTLFKGDANGANWLDVSSESLAQIGHLVASGNTAFNNTIVVTSLVADTTSATTFAGVTNFQELAIGGPVFADGPAGTINMANLPTTISDILYLTQAEAAVTINNVTRTLTIDTENNGNGTALTVGAVNPDSGYTDALNIIIGNADNPVQTGTTAAKGVLGAITLFGEEAVGFVSQGLVPFGTAAPNANDTGTVLLTPTPGGGEHVTITGDSSIAFGYPTAPTIWGGVFGSHGGIFDLSAATGFDNFNDLVITDTNAGATYLEADLLGTFGVDQNFGASTNAFILNASGSGTGGFDGLLMRGGDSNFVVGNPIAHPNVASGDTITGSAATDNIIIGSLGNDTIVGTLNTGAADTIGTNGGADKITLAIGHTASDHIDLFDGYSTGPAVGGSALTAFSTLAGVGGTIVGNDDTGLPGYWAASYFTPLVPTGPSPFIITGALLAAGLGGGTSIDQSTVANFSTASDVLDFSISSWGYGGTTTVASALLAEHANGLLNTAGVAEHGIGAHTATFANVSIGGTINNAIASGIGDVIVLGGSTFQNAAAVASSLSGAGTAINFTTAILGGGGEGHFLLAYQNTAGNTVLADLDIISSAAPGTTTTAASATETIAISDMVQLTGVTLNTLHAANVHLVG